MPPITSRYDLAPNTKRGKLKDDHFAESKSYQIFQAKIEKGANKKTNRKKGDKHVAVKGKFVSTTFHRN